jgi:hypothetical protein
MTGRELGYPRAKDGKMLRNQLRSLKKESIELHNALLDSDSLPQWVISQVSVALHEVTQARHYIEAKLAGYEPNSKAKKAKELTGKALGKSKKALSAVGRMLKKGAVYTGKGLRVGAKRVSVAAAQAKVAGIRGHIRELEKCGNRLDVSTAHVNATKAMKRLQVDLNEARLKVLQAKDRFDKSVEKEFGAEAQQKMKEMKNPMVPDVWNLPPRPGKTYGFHRGTVTPGHYDKLPLPKRSQEELYYETQSGAYAGVAVLTVQKRGYRYMLYHSGEIKWAKNAAEARKEIEKFLKTGALKRTRNPSSKWSRAKVPKNVTLIEAAWKPSPGGPLQTLGPDQPSNIYIMVDALMDVYPNLQWVGWRKATRNPRKAFAKAGGYPEVYFSVEKDGVYASRKGQDYKLSIKRFWEWAGKDADLSEWHDTSVTWLSEQDWRQLMPRKVKPSGFDERAHYRSSNPRKRKKNTGKDVAQTILRQMGGQGRIRAMTGAHTFVAYSDKRDSKYGEDMGGVSFKFPRPSRGKPNFVKIILRPDDTYRMQFGSIHGHSYKIRQEYDGVYNDQLKPLFEETTGLYLSF